MEAEQSTLDSRVAEYFKWSPLHVAASRGETEELLRLINQNPDLVDVLDSRSWSALHLASAKGHVEAVKALVVASPEMCFAVDRDGRNPVHIAALKGKAAVLTELVQESPHAALAQLTRGESETALHLCVKHNRPNCLHILLQMIRDEEFVNAKDSGGNTILHLAVAGKQKEMVIHILENSKIDANTTNTKGHTAMDLLLLAKSDSKDEDHLRLLNSIEDFLRKANAKRGMELVQGEWVTKKRDALMVVASLIATMAFQAAVNPPGGVWQDTKDNHRAGEAVMAYNHPHSYPYFLRFNTIGFVASLSTILLLISGLPFKKKVYMSILMVIMWLTITSMAITYTYSIIAVTPSKDRKSLAGTIGVAVIVWCSVIAVLLLVHTVRVIANGVGERWSRDKATGRISNRHSTELQNSVDGSQNNV